jgi:hypothetical protein
MCRIGLKNCPYCGKGEVFASHQEAGGMNCVASSSFKLCDAILAPAVTTVRFFCHPLLRSR